MVDHDSSSSTRVGDGTGLGPRWVDLLFTTLIYEFEGTFDEGTSGTVRGAR